jgi:5-methyltetrahydrofolate--homocysteine methyltransferase
VPVIVGGAAINRGFGARANFVDDAMTRVYAGGVFYCKDAFEGLEVVGQLVEPEAREALLASVREQALVEARRVASERAEAAA